MTRLEKMKELLNKTNFDSLNKVEIAILFWNSGYDSAHSVVNEVLINYEGLETVKEHLKEDLQKE